MKAIQTHKRTLSAFLMLTAVSLQSCAYNGTGTTYSNDEYDEYGNKVSTAAKKKPTEPEIAGPIRVVETSIGTVLAGGPDGKTLYTFAKDNGSISTCYDACAAAWPPFIAANPALAKDSLTVTGRSDGTIQWVFDGRPLYFWAGDTKEGQTTGASISNWSVAKP